MKMKATIMAATAVLLLMVPAQAASPPKKAYPDFFEFYWRMYQCHGNKTLDCDYTSKTCLSGYSLLGDFAGVVLAEDRQTVLAHVVGISGTWYNADTGVVQDRGMIIPKMTPWKIHPDELEKFGKATAAASTAEHTSRCQNDQSLDLASRTGGGGDCRQNLRC